MDNSIVSGARAAAPLLGAGVTMYFGFRGTFTATAVLFAIVWITAMLYLPRHTVPNMQLQTVAVGD